jgi:hypothetical protein
MSAQNHKLPYPVIFQAPTEAVPLPGRETILRSGFNLLKIKDGSRFVEVGLPKDAWQVSLEEVGTVLFGAFFNEDGQKISSFTIDGEGSVTYFEE